MKTKKMNCVRTCGWEGITLGNQYEVYKIRYDGYQTLFLIFGDDDNWHWIPNRCFNPMTVDC